MYVGLILPRSAREILQWASRAGIVALALTATVPALAATAFIDGEATYRERTLPPPDATLVVTLQDTSLGDPQRLAVRARIFTPAGLWMTTDTVMSALGGPSPLSLRLVSAGAQPAPAATAAMPASAPSADTCAGAASQADMTRCVHEDFEAAGSGYAQRYRELSQPLAGSATRPPAPHARRVAEVPHRGLPL